MVRGAIGLVAVGLLGAVVASAAVRLERDVPEPDAGRLVYLPDAKLLSPLVLGYDNVLADVLWFRTINYFGEHYATDRSYPWLASMCDVVTDLDPRAEHVYRFAGVILPWEAKRPDEGIRLLEKGIRALPDSWLLHYYAGIVHFLFRSDYAQAAEHLRRAAELPGAPPLVARIAAVMYTRRYGPETTVDVLRQMRDSADSEQLRDVLDEKIRDAQLTWDLERLAALVATYRSRFGHAPASLAALVDVGLLRGVPPDPFGGTYEIEPATGAVRSSTGRAPQVLRQSPRRQAMGATN